MPPIHVIDLHFLGRARAIAVFAVPDNEGVTLVECGPFSTHDRVLAGLSELGYSPGQVHTVLLTHIHFDHAGAAWWWARNGANVYVHPRGYRHLLDPARLYGSAARLYGEENMERLWGKMETIAEDRLIEVKDRQEFTIGGLRWAAHFTPGHAKHHLAWQLQDVIFTGDVGGVVIDGGPPVPPCPPPDIDVEAWEKSIQRIRSLQATTLYLTHFGAVPATDGHFTELLRRLHQYVVFVRDDDQREGDADEGGDGARVQRELDPAKGGVQAEDFKAMVAAELLAAGCAESTIEAYMVANPAELSVAGIRRYLEQTP